MTNCSRRSIGIGSGRIEGMIPFRNTFDPIPTIVQRSLHLILVLLSGLCATAQDCSIPFTEPLFEVQERSDIWYGNAPRFNGGSDSLRLNLFTPIGDGQTERPLVIAIHGGGLIEGHRNELNDYCRIMASMGWAAATVTYRLGYYGTGILDPPYAYDPNEMRRAIFRAMQDAKGAIRFLKGRHEEDSTSTNNVLLAGFSAGSITAMHAAYLDQPEEKPAAAFAIGDVQHFFDFYPRPDLGSIDGDLNQNGSNASILGVSNFFGALLDTTFIGSATDPALYSYHQTMDPVVACGLNRPYWGIGLGIPDNLPYLFGSCMLDLRVQHLGFSAGRYQFSLHPGNAHEVHDPPGELVHNVQWMRDLFCTTTSTEGKFDRGTTTLYPNPTSGPLVVDLGGIPEPALITVHDVTGKLVHLEGTGSGRLQLDFSGLRPGLFLVSIQTGDRVERHRVIRE
jgi:alpha/beta superfamily hydrolase